MMAFLERVRSNKLSGLVLKATVLILFFVALVFRFWHLNTLPVAYYHDELDYVITGQSLRQWGTDLTGDWKPTELRPVKTLNYTAELTPVIHAGIQTVFGPAVSSGRLPGAIFGLATVGLTGAFFWTVLRRWQPAVLAMVWVAMNPWHLYLSRLGYEAIISLFFQLGLVFSVVKLSQAFEKKRMAVWLLMAAASQWLAYYTYHSAKFLIPVLTVTLLAWHWYRTRSWKRTIVATVVLLGAAISLLGHSLEVQRAGWFGERQSEMLFSTEYLQETVNLVRHQAIEVPGMRWWYNKPVVLVSELVKHYASVFDVYRLFISGYEGGFQFSLAVHGFFTLSSIPLMVIGAVWLWRNSRSSAVLIFSLILVSPVSTTIMKSYQSIFRSAMVYFLLATLAGLGAYAVWQWLSKQRWGTVIWIGVVLLFLVEFLWFGTRYFSRYPIVTADNHYFPQKLLAGYLLRSDQPTHVVLEDYNYSTARSFVFYQNRLPDLTLEERQQFQSQQPEGIQLGAVHFSQGCPTTPLDEGALYVVEPGQFVTCQLDDYFATASSSLVKIRQTDSGQVFDLPGLASAIDNRTYYYLLGDQVCGKLPESTFIHPTKLRLFDPVKLSNEELCQNWIKLDPKPVPSVTTL